MEYAADSASDTKAHDRAEIDVHPSKVEIRSESIARTIPSSSVLIPRIAASRLSDSNPQTTAGVGTSSMFGGRARSTDAGSQAPEWMKFLRAYMREVALAPPAKVGSAFWTESSSHKQNGANLK